MDKNQQKNCGVKSSDIWQVVCYKKRRYTKQEEEYETWLKHCHEDETLEINGFGRSYAEAEGTAIYYNTPHEKNRPQKRDAKIWECYRCKQGYEVDQSGKPVKNETCRFHTKKLTFDKNEISTLRYSCCKNLKNSIGCQKSDAHIIYRLEDKKSPHGYPIREGFVQSKRKPVNKQNRNIFGIDCEMCFTTCGIELIRVTVVNLTKDVVYDSLVLPEHEVLDYATCFSGITAEDMKHVTKTLGDVQEDFLEMFCSKSIFVGHSLENDLNAIKFIHNKIIDTSVLFPHPKYKKKNYKYSLQVLAESILGKKIQNPAKNGHDSYEDAVTSLELAYKYVVDPECSKTVTADLSSSENVKLTAAHLRPRKHKRWRNV